MKNLNIISAVLKEIEGIPMTLESGISFDPDMTKVLMKHSPFLLKPYYDGFKMVTMNGDLLFSVDHVYECGTYENGYTFFRDIEGKYNFTPYIESMNYDSWKDNLVGLYLYGQIMKAQRNSREYNKVRDFFLSLDCYIEFYPHHAIIKTASLSDKARVTVRGYDSNGEPKYEFAVPSGIEGAYRRVKFIEEALEMIRHQ